MSYDIDTEYDSWLNEQVQLLRNRALDQLDIENLIEELEALVRGEKAAVESFAYQIMLHLLLVDYWHEESERNRNHWDSEITGFRIQLENKLTTNLGNHLENRLDYLYQKAREAAVKKTRHKISETRFPSTRCYRLNQVIDEA